MTSNLSNIYTSLASFPGAYVTDACEMSQMLNEDPFYGCLSGKKIQLVPQNRGYLDEEIAAKLVQTYPEVEFRLHANVRIAHDNTNVLKIVDLSNYDKNIQWFQAAARVSKILNAKAYTLHSGYVRNASLQQVLNTCKELQNLFGCKVGIEGQYPTAKNDLLLTTWDDYAEMLESGCFYALDLSHLNIVQRKLGPNMSLCQELVSSENCIELHISDNNGFADIHSSIREEPWWHELFLHVQRNNPSCDVFYEGNLRRTNQVYE